MKDIAREMDNDLNSLQEKIAAARGLKNAPEKPQKSETSRAGAQAGIELVVAIFAGGFIGYWIDEWAGTRPLFMILMFFLGVATGFYNVYRISQGLGTSVGGAKNNTKTHNSDLSEPEKDDRTLGS